MPRTAPVHSATHTTSQRRNTPQTPLITASCNSLCCADGCVRGGCVLRDPFHGLGVVFVEHGVLHHKKDAHVDTSGRMSQIAMTGASPLNAVLVVGKRPERM